MKKFVLQFSVFSAGFALISLANFFVNSYLIYSIPPEINGKVLIMGDSHMVRALDPQILGDAENFSQLSESYFMTYFKLKELLKHSNPETLILGYSYHNISASGDRKFIDPNQSNEMFKRMYPITSITDYESMEVDYNEYLKVLYRNMFLYPRFRHHTYLGSFEPRSEEMRDTWEAAIKRHYFLRGQNVGISLVSEEKLQSIIEIARENKLRVILVATPLHRSYRTKIPENFKHEFREFASDILAKHDHVQFWDYSDEFDDSGLFFNSDHVNNVGAQRFTISIKRRLENRDF